MAAMEAHWTQPSHPEVLEVVSQPGSFASYSRATKAIPSGAVIARLSAPTLTLSGRAYSSVQVGPNHNIELNSDLLYLNHSCEPTAELHVLNSEKLPANQPNGKTQTIDESNHPIVIEFRVAHRTGTQGIEKGGELTFFYPSTEWDMAQPFDCQCKTKSCRGMIRGAKYLSSSEMSQYFVNDFIRQLWKVQHQGTEDASPAIAETNGGGDVKSSQVRYDEISPSALNGHGVES